MWPFEGIEAQDCTATYTVAIIQTTRLSCRGQSTIWGKAGTGQLQKPGLVVAAGFLKRMKFRIVALFRRNEDMAMKFLSVLICNADYLLHMMKGRRTIFPAKRSGREAAVQILEEIGDGRAGWRGWQAAYPPGPSMNCMDMI